MGNPEPRVYTVAPRGAWPAGAPEVGDVVVIVHPWTPGVLERGDARWVGFVGRVQSVDKSAYLGMPWRLADDPTDPVWASAVRRPTELAAWVLTQPGGAL